MPTQKVTLKIPASRLSCLLHTSPVTFSPSRGREGLRAILEASGVALLESEGPIFVSPKTDPSYQHLHNFVRASREINKEQTLSETLVACAGCFSDAGKKGRSNGNHLIWLKKFETHFIRTLHFHFDQGEFCALLGDDKRTPDGRTTLGVWKITGGFTQRIRFVTADMNYDHGNFYNRHATNSTRTRQEIAQSTSTNSSYHNPNSTMTSETIAVGRTASVHVVGSDVPPTLQNSPLPDAYCQPGQKTSMPNTTVEHSGDRVAPCAPMMGYQDMSASPHQQEQLSSMSSGCTASVDVLSPTTPGASCQRSNGAPCPANLAARAYNTPKSMFSDRATHFEPEWTQASQLAFQGNSYQNFDEGSEVPQGSTHLNGSDVQPNNNFSSDEAPPPQDTTDQQSTNDNQDDGESSQAPSQQTSNSAAKRKADALDDVEELAATARMKSQKVAELTARMEERRERREQERRRKDVIDLKMSIKKLEDVERALEAGLQEDIDDDQRNSLSVGDLLSTVVESLQDASRILSP